MHAGFKHLFGGFSTLLLLLTIILWVDSYWHVSVVGVQTSGGYVAAIYTGNQKLDLICSYSDMERMKFRIQMDQVPNNSRLSFGLDKELSWTKFGFGYAWDKERTPPVWGMRLPLWCLPALFVVPSFFYLRFLVRRRRGGAVRPEARGR